MLAAQLLVVVVSRARGPLLGLLLGLAVAGFALLVRRRAWKGLAAAAVVTALVAGGLVLLNVPSSPLAPLAKLPLLQRLSEMSNARHRNPVSFRLQVWEGVLRSWGDQLRGQTVIPGTSPLVRSIVGYGPETELIALDPMAKRALGHPRAGRERWSVYYLVDRAHNVVLEQLMRGGLVGLLLWLVLVPMIVIVGAIRVRQSGSEAEAVLRLGGIAAIVAHVSELQVGFATATSLALFWIIAAWVTLPRWLVRPEPVPDPVGATAVAAGRGGGDRAPLDRHGRRDHALAPRLDGLSPGGGARHRGPAARGGSGVRSRPQADAVAAAARRGARPDAPAAGWRGDRRHAACAAL